MKVYISGKIGDLPKEVYEKNFGDAKKEFESAGHVVVSPLDLDHSGHDGSWQRHMIVDLEALCDCDAIFMLDNWRESPGAKIEHDFARKAGKTILYTIDL